MPSEYLQVARYHARKIEALLLQARESPDGSTRRSMQEMQPFLEVLTHAQIAIAALIVEMESRG